MKVSTPVQANPGYFPGGFVSPAVHLQPLSLLGLYDASVEEPDHHCIPLGYPLYVSVLCWSPWGPSIEIAGLSRWMLPFRAALQLPSRGCCHFPASLPGDSPLKTASCPLSPFPYPLQEHLSEQALFLLRITLQSHRSRFPAQSLSSPEFHPSHFHTHRAPC